MLVLGSYGFIYPITRDKISKELQDKQGKFLIISVSEKYGIVPAKTEKKQVAFVGFSEENIYIFDEENADEYFDMKFDYISVSGGNTFELLNYIREHRLDVFIKKQVANGAVYIGNSAGTNIAGPSVEHIKIFENNEHIYDDDFTGLALTDKYFLCLSEFRKPEDIDKCYSVIGKDEELVNIGKNKIKVIK